MSFDPKQMHIIDDLFIDDDWILHKLFTRIVFDSLLKDIVRGHYRIDKPVHITLHLRDDDIALFVWELERALVYQNHDQLFHWALSFVAADVFDIDPGEIQEIYLDTAVGDLEPYLYVKTNEVVFSSGDQSRKGRFL